MQILTGAELLELWAAFDAMPRADELSVVCEIESLGAPYIRVFGPGPSKRRRQATQRVKLKRYKGSNAAKRASRSGGNPVKRTRCAS
jgi:hypothetical protein